MSNQELNRDDIRPQFRPDVLEYLDQTAIFQSALDRGTSGLTIASRINELDLQTLSEVSGFKELAAPWFSDQILPFDITLAGTNEQGAATCTKSFKSEQTGEQDQAPLSRAALRRLPVPLPPQPL